MNLRKDEKPDQIEVVKRMGDTKPDPDKSR